MHQRTGQHSFADEVVASKGQSSRLERIDELIDWEPVAALVAPIFGSPTGRPSYPPLVMVKALILAHWLATQTVPITLLPVESRSSLTLSVPAYPADLDDCQAFSFS